MVDNILKDSHEVGYSSGEEAELSGDEIKTPVFVIKRDGGEEAKNATMLDDDERDYSDEELFI